MRIFEFLECAYNTRATYRLFQIGNFMYLIVTSVPEISDNQYYIAKAM